MLRQTSSRNHRSKGLKLKKALQISLLVIVSIWLLYQVKHSYEKKVYVETDSNELQKDDDRSQGEVIKFGRKDLPSKMEADSSTLDERMDDEENDEMEQEMKHDDNEDDPIDEQDQEKDDDAPELGEKEEKEGEVDEVFGEEEHKERSQEDQEKSFHGDNVSSAIVHDAPAMEHEVATREAREKSFHADNVSSAVPHNNQEAELMEEESLKAQEKSFKGDDVSNAVDHDPQVTRPLPEEHLASVDQKFEGTAHLSNGITVQVLGANESSVAGDHGATPINVPSSNSTLDKPNNHLEKKIDLAAENYTDNQSVHAGSERTNSTSLNSQPKQQTNSTAVLNNQIQLFTNLTTSGAISEATSPPNGTSDSTDGHKIVVKTGKSGEAFSRSIVNTRELDMNSGNSSILANNKANEERGDAHNDQLTLLNIQKKAMSEDEVLLE